MIESLNDFPATTDWHCKKKDYIKGIKKESEIWEYLKEISVD